MNAKRHAGIAIVSVLVIMVAMMALGTGAFLLTQVNLGIVSNVRTNILAKSYAESGLDAAQIALEEYYAAQVESTWTGDLPASGTLVPPSINAPGFQPSYTLLEYTRLSESEAIVVVRGDGPRDSEHVTEALVAAFPGEPELPPFYDYGLSSMGVITTNGTSTYINAGIHGNLGYDLGTRDTFAVCVARDADGVCTSSDQLAVEDAPVSSTTSWSTCSPASLCDADGAPRAQTDPVSISADYVEQRDIAIFEASSGSGIQTSFSGFDEATGITAPITCDLVLGDVNYDWSSVADGTTVCVESNTTVSIPDGTTLTNVNLLTLGDVNLGRNVSLSGSTVVSMTGSVQAGSNGNNAVSVTNSKIFSETGITLNGNQTSISGETTLASGGDVTINGGSPPTVNDDGQPAVGLVVLSEGNVTVNGSSDWYVVAVAEGTFTQNGTSTVYGRAAAVGDMTFNGGIDIDSGLDIVNDDIERPGAPYTRALSRR